MELADDLSPEQQATVELAAELRESGNLHPVIERLRNGDVGPECAREVLLVLAEIDLDQLVQITLDGLIREYVEDAGAAHQPNRVVRGRGGPEG